MRSRWLDIGQVLFLVCLWTETESRSINSQKPTRPISSHLHRTSLIYYTAFGKIFLASPAQARELHLARSGSQLIHLERSRSMPYNNRAYGNPNICNTCHFYGKNLLFYDSVILGHLVGPFEEKLDWGQILNNVIFRIQYHYSNNNFVEKAI